VQALRFAVNLALALLGMSLMAAALDALGPMSTPLTLDAERVLRERERCQVLFVGPSYVVSQIHPAAFDAESQRLASPLRSCLFGGTGMRGLELRVHLSRLLQEGWPALKLVVVDITLGQGRSFDQGNWYQPRLIQWHTLESARWIFDYYRSTHWNGLDAKVARAHLGHLLANQLNLGVGLEKLHLLALVRRAQRALGARVKLPESDARRAYRSAQAELAGRKKAQANAYMKRTSQRSHDRRVAQLIRAKARLRKTHKTVASDWLFELRELTRSHRAEIAFIEAPVWLARRTKLQRKAARALPMIDFNDPAKYPPLYLRKHRGNTHHVNWYGGEVYSRLLASELSRRKLVR
jgi:hypothetical protein